MMMVMSFISKLFGDPNARKVKQFFPIVDEINDLEPHFEALSDEALCAKTEEFKALLQERPKSDDPTEDRQLEQEALDALLPEAFATVREASKRVLGMRHYDVQLIGGMVLHKGDIAEMRTGEGKTLVATLPAYLNALTGKGVHVVTVNDYLAKRDAEWMGKLYRFLGLSVGMVLSGESMMSLDNTHKKIAYGCDITYGTNNEFGFDYLRDNMATNLENLCQRKPYYAIIDEVDSILIDEARTPLIISGKVEQSPETYQTFAKIAPLMQKETDYTVDEKAKNIVLTEEGVEKAEKMLGQEDLFDAKTNFAHLLIQALRAKELYRKDIDYVITPKQDIAIVDEFTGRIMEGRRWSDGLHQSIEAKERVAIQDETQTLASITFQNLFRLYEKLSGMTGTAMTEEAEFSKIYNLSVTSIPTHLVNRRKDLPDLIYKNERIKFFKVVEDIVEKHETQRPVLVGTTSIEKSEYLSQLLHDPEPLQEHWNEKVKRFSELMLPLIDQVEAPHQTTLHALLTSPLKVDASSVEESLTWLQASKLRELYDLTTNVWATARALQAIHRGLPHTVLNAKFHEQEASIVAQAGRQGAITIATNMAGRGTDILLGGNAEFLVREAFQQEGQYWKDVPEATYQEALKQRKAITDAEKKVVTEAGGLHIIGTERHESRRIDNQLRGRAARQGDPGSTQFFLSLEDGFLRIFQGGMISNLMDMLNVEETLPISHSMVTKSIEGAQRKVEAYHFEIRKNVLRYDDILTTQRQLLYNQRREVLESQDLRAYVRTMGQDTVVRMVRQVMPDERNLKARLSDPEQLQLLLNTLGDVFPYQAHEAPEYARPEALLDLTGEQVVERLQDYVLTLLDGLESSLVEIAQQLETNHGIDLAANHLGWSPEYEGDTPPAMTETQRQEALLTPLRQLERSVLLQLIDQHWIEYLQKLDALRDGIGLRAYGQKDPLLEYKREAYEMFQQLSYDIQHAFLSQLLNGQLQINIQVPEEQFMQGFGETLANATPMTEEALQAQYQMMSPEALPDELQEALASLGAGQASHEEEESNPSS